jgi:hypothetical protein
VQLQILAIAIVSPLLLTGCQESFACLTNIEPAVIVTPVLASSGAAIESDGKGVITKGSFRDSLQPYQLTVEGVPTSFAGFGQSGVYTVTLEIPGYAAWQRNDVSVDAGSCGVVTSRLKARLVPAP